VSAVAGGDAQGSGEAQMSSTSDPAKCFIVLYRWRLHPGSEASFVEAWSRVSDRLRSERGSLGSRLHSGSDGLWYSYAQWPSAAARDEAFALGPVDAAAGHAMKDAIAERLPDIVLDCASDFLLPIHHGSSA
jgi:heme-degrading monooxygenase HmoA